MDDALGAPGHLQRSPVAAVGRRSTTAWRTSSRRPSRSTLAGPSLPVQQQSTCRSRAGAGRLGNAACSSPDSHSRTNASERVSRVSRSMPTLAGAGRSPPPRRRRGGTGSATNRQQRRRRTPPARRRRPPGPRPVKRNIEHGGDQRLRRPPPEPPVGPPLGHGETGQHGTLGPVSHSSSAGTSSAPAWMPGHAHRGAPVRSSSSLATPRSMASMT